MARQVWIDEGLYVLLGSEADDWGCEIGELLTAAAAYGLGAMMMSRWNPSGFRDPQLAALERYLARLGENHGQ
jgi:hypothetical protein